MDWKKTLATVAPTIATALGGPLAGVAVNVASKALGFEPDERSLEKAVLTGDSDALMQLKQAEQLFLIRLEELGIERDRIAADDRSNARGLFKVDKRPQIILSAVFIIGYFAILISLMSGAVEIPDNFKDSIILLLGILTREVPTIMQFWFGSSSGSKDKTKGRDSD